MEFFFAIDCYTGWLAHLAVNRVVHRGPRDHNRAYAQSERLAHRAWARFYVWFERDGRLGLRR
jgi:hypothetical protein